MTHRGNRAAGFGVLSLADALTPENTLIVIAISMVIYGGSVALGLRAGPWSLKRHEVVRA